MKRWVTVFDSENVHLIKDVGMIGYIMGRDFGYESTLATYQNGEYPYADKEVKGLKLEFIKRKTGKFDLDSMIWIWKNAKSIDVLQLFHMRRYTLLKLWLYKIRNPKGKVYLKLDGMSPVLARKIVKEFTWKVLLKNLKNCNVVSLEKGNVQEIEEIFGVKILKIPNGYYDDGTLCHFKEKDNIICTCGRLGTYVKNTQLMLEGYTKAFPKISNWKLKLIGPIETEFNQYIDKWKKKNPDVAKKVEFTGEIVDRREINYYYDKCKIFCFTSRNESFGLVLSEASSRGCYLVSSDVGAASDIVSSVGNGRIYEDYSVDGLASALVEECTKLEGESKELYENIAKRAKETLNWESSCRKLAEYLE